MTALTLDSTAVDTLSAVADGTGSEELARRNIEAIARLEKTALSERTPVDRIVDTITTFCGSMAFVYVHAVWFGFWVVWNTLLAKHAHFDPYPFQLLTLVVSLEAIFLSTFILISQNRQARLADRRNHLDLQVNLLAEQESTKMLALLEAVARKLNVPCDDDPELTELARETHPETLVAAIEQVIEHKEDIVEAECKEKTEADCKSASQPGR